MYPQNGHASLNLASISGHAFDSGAEVLHLCYNKITGWRYGCTTSWKLTTDKWEKDPPSDVEIQACLFNPKAKPLLQTAESIWIDGQRNGESGQPI